MLSRASTGGVWNMARMMSSIVNSDGSNFLARGYGTSTQRGGLPSRPMNAYMLFVKSEGAKERAVAANVTAASKNLGARWKAMSDMEKSRYVNQAKTAKEEYELTLARMDQKVLGDLLAEKRKAAKDKNVKKAKASLSKVIKESGMPKKPANGFALFTAKMYQSPDIKSIPDFKTRVQRIMEKWRSMSPQEQKIWQDQSDAGKKAYEVEIANWRKANPDKVKVIEAAQESRAKAVAATKPPPPPKKKAVAKKAVAKKAVAKKAVAQKAVKKVAAKPKVKAKA